MQIEQKHKKEIKPCPVCKGKMDIRWQRSGCYLVCKDCGYIMESEGDMNERDYF